MLRKDKVLNFLKEQYEKSKVKDKHKKEGFSAEFIALELELARNNVSGDLNKLFREGKVEKIEGRPTLYLPRLNNKIRNSSSLKLPDSNVKKPIYEDCFIDLIGFNDSLFKIIKQAQAAILYPPKGLSTILVGETGTGKTTFADRMYRFAVDNSVITRDAPYVIFNCADYANNPQLLISILFGSIKGAYTGNEADRVGLVEKANKGILFLDEVHRLPPEGQEMLFNIIDRGIFRRLGDTSERTTDILIIAATTQDPKSALLDTFLRRFSIIIRLPSLRERSVKERLEIVSSFFNIESIRVKTSIKVSRDVILALLLYEFNGNVGELKSIIELVSSRGYLEYLINQDEFSITIGNLPDSLRNALILISNEKREINEIVGFEDRTFHGDIYDGYELDKDPYDFSREVYEYLEHKSLEYKEKGLSRQEVVGKLSIDLEDALFRYSKGLCSFGIKVSELSKFLDGRIISAVKQISEEVMIKYNYNINEDTQIALCFHINSIIDRKKKPANIGINDIQEKHPSEFEVASYIISKLSDLLRCKIVEDEVGFISLLLHLTKEDINEKRISIMVIAHGDSTASSMAKVANKLLRTNIVSAIDMKLEDAPGDILDKAIKLAQDIDEGKGILLFVDMGSLKTFGYEIEKATGIKTITIDNLNTLSLLEATHKSMLPYFEIKDVALLVLEFNKNVINANINEIQGAVCKEGVIFTVCSTGEGTAVYLKDVIEKVLNQNNIEGIQVIEINISNIKVAIENMRRIAGERAIVAIAGSINPQYTSVPFIDIFEFVMGNGLEKIIQLVTKNKVVNIKPNNDSRTIVYGAICDALDENLHFLSGKKIMPYIDKYIKEFEEKLDKKFDNHKYTLLSMHLAYAIERLKFNGKYDEGILSNRFDIISHIYEDFGVLLDEDDTYILHNINE
jgi:transcriptional regulator with AAA-type ATPase domain/transcriptional regulatory protein LevR